MSIEQMREALKNRYPNWRDLSTMPDKQIAAIYMRKLAQNDL